MNPPTSKQPSFRIAVELDDGDRCALIFTRVCAKERRWRVTCPYFTIIQPSGIGPLEAVIDEPDLFRLEVIADALELVIVSPKPWAHHMLLALQATPGIRMFLIKSASSTAGLGIEVRP